MGKLVLYSPVKVTGQSFKGCKEHTVPMQSMSLKEIITRFVRREALPVMKEGTYQTQMGDLEKLAKEDITVQMDRVEELKANIAKGEKRMKEKAETEAKAARDKEVEEKVAEALRQRDPLQQQNQKGGEKKE